MEFKNEYIFGIIALVVAVAVWWFYFRKPSVPSTKSKVETKQKEKVIIYGSLGCPYTVKQMEKFPDHEFVDCTSQKCPEFVTAYPTTKMPDGRIEIGFS